jgi:hypothetical protein
MGTWSVIKAVEGFVKNVGIPTGKVGVFLGGAIGATVLVSDWVDSEASKIFESVKKREGCSHIKMLEGSPPTPSACLYVSQKGGVAWTFGETSLYFWHQSTSFKPLVFTRVIIPGANGVTLADSSSEFNQKVKRPHEGYHVCQKCKAAQQNANL